MPHALCRKELPTLLRRRNYSEYNAKDNKFR